MPDLENETLHLDQFIPYVPSEKLEEILHNAMLSEDESFSAQAEAAAVELARRQSVEQRLASQAAWNRFVAERAGEASVYADCIPECASQPSGAGKKGRRGTVRSIGRIALIAVAALLVLAIGACAAGWNVFGLFARWNEDYLRFPAAQESVAAAAAYSELMQELDIYAAADQLVPTYLPLGYSHQSTTSFAADSGEVYIASQYQGETGEFILTYRSTDSGQVEYPKDQLQPDVIEQNGVRYYIFTNDEQYSATWINAGFECSLFGLSDRDELIRIVRSIDAKE